MHWIALLPETAAPCGAETDSAALVDADTALGWWALRFTPMVTRLEEALLLEVSGSERLFGGRDALVQRLLAYPPAPCPMRHAQGASALLALARIRCSQAELPADNLPLHTLSAAAAHLPALTRLGCTRWGQLRALPRAGVARRFGAELLAALDRAYGSAPEVYPWLTLPDVFEAALEFSTGVESAPALLFGARRLLAQLQVWLRARQRGVLALELLWDYDLRRGTARHGRLALRTAQATQNMQHLQRLLAEQLAQVHLAAPVLHLHLRTLQTSTQGADSLSLLPQDLRTGDDLHQTLERLQARLAHDAVRCVQAQASHTPERMQQWLPWTGTPAPKASSPSPAHAALYPSWLLEPPLKLAVRAHCPHYHGPLALLAGPQRLEADWLEGAPALRDYFVAHSPQAGLVWVYRERPTHTHPDTALGWYLHGMFA
ncbi:Y-family DNA polymerase [Rhodoferax sp.]|jgi:protein ImuB|uniref:Y-family DNA polymerase n=1 Tax=Rhodoferax sp. TaxID=50421 RepID=UPI0037849CC1